MKLLINRKIIHYKKLVFIRICYSDGTGLWKRDNSNCEAGTLGSTYDRQELANKISDEELEKEYQKLINKRVETTNEQLTETEKVYILNCLDYCDKQDDLDDETYTSIKKKLIV